MARKHKANWVQNGSSITLTINAPRKHRRPTMLYSIEFNFEAKRIDDKKKIRYRRKQKHRLKNED